MPHQCVHCKRILPKASEELFKGCSACGGKFFFYIRDEVVQRMEDENERKRILELPSEEKIKVEEDVREILKIDDEDEPVILDFEAVRVVGPGKFELDLVALMNQRPIVFKLAEGKYIIDLEGLNKKR